MSFRNTVFWLLAIRGIIDSFRWRSSKTTGSAGETYIYMMSHANGFTKIGRSTNPNTRESTLQAEDPQLELIWYHPGTNADETALHRKFAAKRVRGEWFDLTEADRQAVKRYFGGSSNSPSKSENLVASLILVCIVISLLICMIYGSSIFSGTDPNSSNEVVRTYESLSPEEKEARKKKLAAAAKTREESQRKFQESEKKRKQEERRGWELELVLLESELADLEVYPMRVWNSKNGDYSTTAAFVDSSVYKTVILKKESGEVVEVERKRLCHEDLVYLAELKKAEDARIEGIKSLEERIFSLKQQIDNLVID